MRQLQNRHDEPTVRLAPVWRPDRGTLPEPRSAAPVPAETLVSGPPEPAPPVFVARSRFRLLWFRLALCGVALAGVAFVVALVLSVVSGGVSPAAAGS